MLPRRALVRWLLLPGILLVAAPSMQADPADAPPASMPSDVTLASGRVLHNVEVLRWEKERVVLKYSGGADPIPFSLFRIPAPSELPAMRDAALGLPGGHGGKSHFASGRLSLVTKTHESIKVGDVTVYFVPKADMLGFTLLIPASEYRDRKKVVHKSGKHGGVGEDTSEADSWLYEQFDHAPKGSIFTKADGDGKFGANLPPGMEFYAFARYRRPTEEGAEWYVWLKLLGPNDADASLGNGELWTPPAN